MQNEFVSDTVLAGAMLMLDSGLLVNDSAMLDVVLDGAPVVLDRSAEV